MLTTKYEVPLPQILYEFAAFGHSLTVNPIMLATRSAAPLPQDLCFSYDFAAFGHSLRGVIPIMLTTRSEAPLPLNLCFSWGHPDHVDN